MTLQQTTREALETITRRGDIRRRVNEIGERAADVARERNGEPPFTLALACGELSSPCHWFGEFEVVASGICRVRCSTQCAVAIREWAMAIVVACDEVMRKEETSKGERHAS